MKNPDIPICEIIESKMNKLIDRTNQIDDAIEAEPLVSELRILDWIFYQVCSNELKNNLERKMVRFRVLNLTINPMLSLFGFDRL